MVKRKAKTHTGKAAKKRLSSFVSLMKRVILIASAMLISLIALLYLYDRFSSTFNGDKSLTTEVKPSKRSEKVKSAVKATRKALGERQSLSKEDDNSYSTKPTSIKYSFSAGDELPRLEVKRDEQIIRHEGYTVSYNSEYRIANWVAYELTSHEAVSRKSERSNKFVPDPKVKGTTALNEDYTRTGYDRGHLAPAGDMRWSAKAMRESFYLSNICPQKPGLNRGIWKDLEEQSRLWAKENGSLLIATGPVMDDGMNRLGKNRVAIPKRFYKVICMTHNGKLEGVGFIFENKDYGKRSLKSMMMPIDKVEREVGIDFFHSMPLEVQKEMESRVNHGCWSF